MDENADPGESEAVAAFEHLGLTRYEAEVFIALQRIGTGTAREVARASEVPRSQVYSAAESLADRGLVDIQQSSPLKYRPVSPDAARSTLQERIERERERAFEYVDRVRAQSEEEHREDIWTIRGTEGTSDRVAELIGETDRRVVFGASTTERVTGPIEVAIADAADRGLDVTVVSSDEGVRALFAETPGVRSVAPPPMVANNARSGRILIGDDDVLLLSVLDPGGSEGEMAVWSTHTGFATALIQIIEASLGVA